MATDTRSLPAFLSNDADFRSWGSGIAAQLLAMGLVQTADTGQINWTTVNRPGTSTAAGYEIWRFADSLQGTAPVFIKVEYGIAGVADRPSLWFTVGTGSNGSGTINGVVGTRCQIGAASKTAGVTLTSYCSGTTSRLCLVNNYDTSGSFCLAALISRTVNPATGAETADGILTWFASSQNNGNFQIVPFTGSAFAQGIAPTLGLAPQKTASGSNVALCPWLAFIGTPFVFLCALGYKNVDIGATGTFTITYLGATHTYMALGTIISASQLAQNDTTGQAFAMLWE